MQPIVAVWRLPDPGQPSFGKLSAVARTMPSPGDHRKCPAPLGGSDQERHAGCASMRSGNATTRMQDHSLLANASSSRPEDSFDTARADMMSDVTDIGRRLSDFVGGRPIVLVGDSLESLAVEAKPFLAANASQVLLVADGIGLSDPPGDDRLHWRLQNVCDTRPGVGRRRSAQQLGNLDPSIIAWLDARDPHREGMVFNFNGRFHGPQVGGRHVVGAPRPEWVALEDKTHVGSLWREADIRALSARIVRVELDRLLDTSAKLDRGRGVVWAGDARDGVHAGLELTWWIRDALDAEIAFEAASARCDRVRVSSFVEGVPCSIHGIVTNDGVGAMRPTEAFILRTKDPGGMISVGAGTGWEAPEADRQAMRASVKRVGAALRDMVDYRGSFSLDGVLGRDGFVASEINPRLGRAFRMIGELSPELGLVAHAQLLADGWELGLTADEVDNLVVEIADSTPIEQAQLHLPYAPLRQRVGLAWGDGEYHKARNPSPAIAHLECGPAYFYYPGLVRLTVEPADMRPREFGAARVASAFSKAGELLSLPLGHFDPAQPVRQAV